MMVFFMGQFALFTYLRPFLEQVTHVTLGLLSSMLLLAGVSGFTGTALIGRVIGDRLHILLGALTAILAAVAVGIALFSATPVA
jgi:predicted MFS family arabinose efflux permease